MVDPAAKKKWVEKFRAAMAAKEISICGLARLMAEQGGDTSSAMVETCRRKISKWLSLETQTLPNEVAQRQLSDLLGTDLRVTRRSNWEILDARLVIVEDAIAAVFEGQQQGLRDQERLLELCAAIRGMLDARLPARPDKRSEAQ